MPNLLNGVRPSSQEDDGVRPDLYVITPCDEFEAIGGKPTLLTNYQIDEFIDYMRQTTYDPDLMQKMVDLRAGAR